MNINISIKSTDGNMFKFSMTIKIKKMYIHLSLELCALNKPTNISIFYIYHISVYAMGVRGTIVSLNYVDLNVDVAFS